MSPRAELPIAATSLIVGSIGAPVLYIALALLLPKGFADLRDATLATASYYFGIAWAVSAVITLVVGGVLWRFLHRRGWDNSGVYAAIAIAIAIVIGIATGSGISQWEPFAMAVANALLVRAVERLLRRKVAPHEQ
jgi:MFS family permease